MLKTHFHGGLGRVGRVMMSASFLFYSFSYKVDCGAELSPRYAKNNMVSILVVHRSRMLTMKF